MASRNYTDLTIKELYSLSGNECTFPECSQKLITENLTNLSDISHIEGGEEGSPRYNKDLGLKELNGYKNLLAMCKNHNKFIDENEDEYSVMKLKEIKRDHEEKMRSRNYQISDKVVTKIIETENGQTIIQNSEGTQMITQSGNINIGITSIGDVEKLFALLVKNNMPRLRLEAEKIARESVQKYCKLFTDKASKKLDPKEIEKLANTDLQYILTKSILEVGRVDEDELRNNLSNLMIQRIKNSENNLKRIVYNEAIETIPKLTTDGLKIMTLCFILRYAKWDTISNMDDLENSMKSLSPLLDFNNTNAEFQHIAYTGCGETEIAGWKYKRVVLNSYPKLSKMTVTKTELDTLYIPEDVKNELLQDCSESEYEFTITDRVKLSKYISFKNLEESTVNNIMRLFDSVKNRAGQKLDKELNKSATCRKILKLINGSELQHMKLSSVGIVIGAMYYEKITGEQIDIGIWIN